MSIVQRLLALAAVAGLAACGGGFAPQSPATGPSLPAGRAASRSAGYSVSDFHYRIMPLRTAAAHRAANPDALQYPDDLVDYGGPVMTAESTHDIYVNCPAKNQSCWGKPEQFLRGLTGSSFAALLKQYTGSDPSAYTFGDSVAMAYPVYNKAPLYENDLFQILHQAVASRKNGGYKNLWHIFLPQGTDTCFDFSRQCYSPDRPSSMAFCAYHGEIKFSDYGLVIFSVEPYQMIKGCETPKSSGASALTNSTISTLAHETFEAITDPGPKLAWYNFQGGEIGDECEYFVQGVTLGGVAYKTQPMYSNKYHACATGP